MKCRPTRACRCPSSSYGRKPQGPVSQVAGRGERRLFTRACKQGVKITFILLLHQKGQPLDSLAVIFCSHTFTLGKEQMSLQCAHLFAHLSSRTWPTDGRMHISQDTNLGWASDAACFCFQPSVCRRLWRLVPVRTGFRY